jgi:hypothetical protein
VAGSTSVEIKATIPTKQVREGLRRANVTPRQDDRRFIYFFDTPGLDLLRNGIITRARRIPGGDHDSTVKFRPVDPRKVPDKWRRFSGFKIETDASDRSVSTSASLSMPVGKGRIKDVAAGKRPIRDLFDDDQLLFLHSLAQRKMDYTKLRVLGPVTAWRWKFERPALPWPLTAELWRRPDGERILELSIKAPVAQAAVAYHGFMAWLAEVGAERDEGQEAKTRWALTYFASHLPRSGGKTGSGRTPKAKKAKRKAKPARRSAAAARAPEPRPAPARRAPPRGVRLTRVTPLPAKATAPVAPPRPAPPPAPTPPTSPPPPA